MTKLMFSNYRSQVVDSMQTTFQLFIKKNKDLINEEITTYIITKLNLWVDSNKNESEGKNSFFIIINKSGIIMKLSDVFRKVLISSIMKQLGFYASDFEVKDTGLDFHVYITIPPTEI